MNASIRDIQAENTRIQNATNVAKSVIASDKLTLAKLEKDIAARKVKKDALQQQVKGVDANIAYLRNTLTDMKKNISSSGRISPLICTEPAAIPRSSTLKLRRCAIKLARCRVNSTALYPTYRTES